MQVGADGCPLDVAAFKSDITCGLVIQNGVYGCEVTHPVCTGECIPVQFYEDCNYGGQLTIYSSCCPDQQVPVGAEIRYPGPPVAGGMSGYVYSKSGYQITLKSKYMYSFNDDIDKLLILSSLTVA